MNWLKQIFTQQNPSEDFSNALQFTETFKTHMKNQKCPACLQQGNFKLSKIEQGNKGYEIQCACTCGLTAILNQTGFQFIGGVPKQ